VTAAGLTRDAVTDVPTAIVFVASLAAAYRWKSKAAVAGIMLGAAALGWALSRLLP